MKLAVISSAQAKAARELLGWSSIKVARCLQVLKAMVDRIEGVGCAPVLTPGMARRLKDLYESHGIEFFDETNGPGVKLHGDLSHIQDLR